MENIAGIFHDPHHAHMAVAALMDKGFTKDDISIIMSDRTQKRLFNNSQTKDDLARGGATGAATGVVLGGIIAGLTAIGTLSIPGVGLLASGPIIAMLSGAGAGATIGGLLGALLKASGSATTAKHYEEVINDGNIVLIVHTKSAAQVLAATEVMKEFEGATEVV